VFRVVYSGISRKRGEIACFGSHRSGVVFIGVMISFVACISRIKVSGWMLGGMLVCGGTGEGAGSR
jgi:hypothetical protein